MLRLFWIVNIRFAQRMLPQAQLMHSINDLYVALHHLPMLASQWTTSVQLTSSGY